MERDFMGLTHPVKQEVLEEPTDPVGRSLSMQWNNTSAHPFKGAQEDRPKVGFHSLASTGLVTITTTEAVDSTHRPVSQKNMVLEKQGETLYTLPAFPPHHYDVHSDRVLRVASPTPVSVALPAHRSFISPANPLPSPVTGSAIVGTTDLRSAPKTSTAPAQLTIFYAGSVCVYDNVSPEKAQAIMLLAGNAPPVTPSATSTTPLVQAPTLFGVNQCHSTLPTLSSPISTISHGASQSAGVSSNTNTTPTTPQSQTSWGQLVSSNTNTTTTTMPQSQTSWGRLMCSNTNAATTTAPQSLTSWGQFVSSNTNTTTTPPQSQTSWGQFVSSNTNGVTISMKSIGVPPSPSIRAEPSKVGSSVVPSAVPQARKASLARFLEKRKERVITASPYPNSKQQSAESGSGTFSMNSSGSCPHVINLVN